MRAGKGESVRQLSLFPEDAPAPVNGAAARRLDVDMPAPTPEALGTALLGAARLAVNKRLFWGQAPKGLSKEDLVSEILVSALPRARRYRPGKIKLENYCYVLACNCLTDFFRARARRLRDYENGSKDKDACDAEDTISLFDAGIEERGNT